MKKIINHINITTLVIINTLLICPALFAQDISADQSRHMLSPIVQINNQVIQQGFNLNNPQLTLNYPSVKSLESFSLDQLTTQIILQCEHNNFSLLKINWQKKHLDYQQFIKEAAAINSAINHFIHTNHIPRDMNYFLFLEKAIQTKIEIIKKSQALLSETGIKELNSIKHQNAQLNSLVLLMNPPKEWFIPLFDNTRKQALLNNYNHKNIVATWGCSTQCDHCDGSAVIEIESFPWIWIKDVLEINSQLITPIEIAPFHNDHFRDYYDLIYDKDASHLYTLLDRELTSTSGFAPGSVGERALKRVLAANPINPSLSKGLFQVSVVQSAWMRSIIQKGGVKEYISYLENIKNIFDDAGAGNSLHFESFNFKRINDPAEYLEQILQYCEDSSISNLDSLIHISGRIHQLESAGEIDSTNTNTKLYILPSDPSKNIEDEHFIFDDLEEYFFLPDGQVIKGVQPDMATLLRKYKTVPGLKSIGKRKIKCLACKSPDCDGKLNKDCIGRRNLFLHQGLSPSGGFSKAYLFYQSSI